MLTDTKARAAKAKGKPYKLTDRDGLYLFITAKGAKAWRYDYRIAGVRETLTIGRYPEISLNDARAGKRKAGFISLSDARALVARGESPAKAKQASKAQAKVARANTVRALGEAWYEARAKSRSVSWRGNAERWLTKDVYPLIGDKPIREVTVEDVERLVHKVADKRGAKSAHYMRLLLAGLFKSLPRHLNAGNPARDVGVVIDLPKVKSKGRAMTAKEIPAFLNAADAYPGRPQTKLAIRLLMLTFVRKRELIEATWDEIDLDQAEWVIPAERMKRDKPHIVPLSRQALECFQKLKRLAGDNKHVFPHISRPGQPMNASTLNTVFERIGYGGKFTPHGARSTASTILNAQGWNSDVIERQLSHSERDLVRAAYNHSDYMGERQKMMQSWADYLDALSAGGDIVSIRRRA